MLARVESEIAYAQGRLRVVSRTKVVAADPTNALGLYLEQSHRDYRRVDADLVAAIEAGTIKF